MCGLGILGAQSQQANAGNASRQQLSKEWSFGLHWRELPFFITIFLTILLAMLGSAKDSSAQIGPPYYLQAHWDFSSAFTSATDVSGNGHNGIVHNCTPVPGCDGNPDEALRFHGVNSWVQVPYSSNFCIGEWTINAVVKFHSFNTSTTSGSGCQYSSILQYAPWASDNFYSMTVSDDPTDGSCTISSPSNQQFIASAGSALPTGGIPPGPYLTTGQWYCLTATYRQLTSGDWMDYYINGQLVQHFKWNSTFGNSPCPTADLLIGKGDYLGATTWLDADIDDIKIYLNGMNATDVGQYFPCPCGGNIVIDPIPCHIDDILTWTSLSTAFTYNFMATVSPSTSWIHWKVGGTIIASQSSTLPFSYTFPSPGSYTICAQAYDPITNEPCDEQCFDICIGQSGLKPAPTKTGQSSLKSDIIGEPFPNPTNSKLIIPIHNYQGKVEVTVSDLEGKLVLTQVFTKTSVAESVSLNTQTLSAGTYLIKVSLGSSVSTKKFSKL